VLGVFGGVGVMAYGLDKHFTNNGKKINVPELVVQAL